MSTARFISIIMLTATVFLACKKDTVLLPVDLGYDYIPANAGDYIIYDVDSIYYNDFTGTVDTFHFQVKERIHSVFTNNTGQPALRIERFKPDTATDKWILKDVWSANKSASGFQKVEENVRYLMLVFPVRTGKTWNGNAYNTLGEKTYEYDEVDAPYQLGSLSFDSTATVIQDNFISMVSEEIASEVYARNAGLIYKRYRNVEKNIITGKIEGGVDYEYRCVAYGSEEE